MDLSVLLEEANTMAYEEGIILGDISDNDKEEDLVAPMEG